MIEPAKGKKVLELECIGDDTAQVYKRYRSLEMFFNHRDIPLALKGLPWVAEITGFHREYQYKREFLEYMGKDYSRGNSVGSRGVYVYYLLEADKIYEVYDRVSWKKSDRYFCKLVDNIFVRLTENDVKEELRCRIWRNQSGQ